MFRGTRAAAALMLCTCTAFGGIVLDGSFGTSGILPGPNYMISANLGKQVGNNLFQSFSQFNLVSSESATFTGPSNIQNILSRVTGGSPSSIDGTINSQIQGANLFFVNPAGVVFGSHAQLNVSGSVAISTAKYLKMADGGRFNANLGGGDTLTSAPISTFGFLNSNPASVSIASATLNGAPGKSFSVIAGDITLDGTQLSAPGGNVALFSARATGEVAYDDSAPSAHFRDSTLSGFGNITIQGSATVAIDSPEGGGGIGIRAGQLVVTGSSAISSINQGANVGGDIELTADTLSVLDGARVRTQATSDGAGGNLSIQSTDLTVDGYDASRVSSIRSTAQSGSGNAGSILVNATNLALTNGGEIRGSSVSAGRGADITITADEITISGVSALTMPGFDSGGGISAQTFSSGNGGNVSVHAGSLSIDRSAAALGVGIGSDTLPGATGDAGNVTITVDRELSIVGGIISSDTFSSGKAGNVTVHASSLSIDGGAINSQAGNASGGTSDITGDAGNVTITVDQALSILGGGEISSSTLTSGKGGNVTVHAGSLSVDGSAIASEAGAGGDAGNVTITVDQALSIVGGGEISSSTFSNGKGGNVSLHAGSLSIDGSATPDQFTGIFAESQRDATGNAGDLTIVVDQALSVIGSGEISATTFSSGKGGDVLVHASSLLIDGSLTPANFTGLSVATEGAGDGGNLNIMVDHTLRLTGGGQITADTSFSGKAGDIAIHANDVSVDNGVISTSTSGSGQGGNVTVDANSILIQDFSLIFATAFFGSTGNAGAVTMKGDSITINGGSSVDSGTGVQSAGDAGAVTLMANSILVDTGGGVFSDSLGTGNSGEITMTANSIVIQGMFSRFTPTIVDTSADGGGNAGDISLTAKSLIIRGGADVSSSNSDIGNAGNITLHADEVRIGSDKSPQVPGCALCNETTVSTDSFGESSGRGGNITIQAKDFRMANDGMLTANAVIDGGNIHITASGLVYLTDSSVTATAGRKGGNITIDPQFIILGNSPISANASAGQGGNINLVSDFFLASNSPVTATGTVANGTVNITAPSLDLGAELITLPSTLVSAESQLRERCTALLQGDFSSFISIGRGGTEPEPDEFQAEF